jgi:aminopeptidase N
MPSLTHDEAVARAALLDIHSYVVELDLTGEDDFAATTTVSFACREPGAATFVEIRPLELTEAVLNGTPLAVSDLADNRLSLTGLAAENRLVVRARMAYSHTGEGLHRFIDPEDGAVYLYGQSFLDDAQRMFACFDQPDLKATLRLSVTAPPEWEVAGNGIGTNVAPGRWEFEPTPLISTYLVSLIAGPYHVLRDSHDGIPLALYCRRALATHLDKDAAELFDLTKACFDRYHALFGVRYPFGGYGQAFVPEFNAGAMENPGIVTFREEFVFRSAVTESERELRGQVIAHEMAHMWFGDLVTMRWWDDLWLNESFAEYMGHRILVEATRFTQAWTDFAIARKGWGYADDQSPSTHPVAPAGVADTSLALLNFDGISYAKGAAVLRQLAVWIGDDAFIAGLRDHFRAHAFGNATLADLLAALSTASGRELAGWAEAWLRRAQVNTLRPEVTLDAEGRYAEVTIVQTAPPAYPTLRPHRVGVGVYSGGFRRERLMVDLDPTLDNGRTPVPVLTGVPAGDLVLVNDDDLTFAKVRFDPASRAALPQTLPTLTDPLARAVVWAAMNDAVRDGETPASELIALCGAALPTETTLSLFRDVIGFAVHRAVDRYLPVSQQLVARAVLVRACRRALDSAEPAGSLQLVAARGYLAAAGPDEVGDLRGWLDGTTAPPGLQVDAELRWAVLTRLCVLGATGEGEIAGEYERDHTAAGLEHAARCRAARPDPVAKAEAWRIIVEDDELSNRLVVAAAEGFWQPLQGELTRPYVRRFFTEMPAMASRRTPNMVSGVLEPAYPRYAVEQSTVEWSEELLARKDIAPALRRCVVDKTDDLRRALVARALTGAGAGAGA